MMSEKKYTQEDFEKAALSGVQSLAKSTGGRRDLRAAILRAFQTASITTAMRKAGIEFDIEAEEREPIPELVEPMLKKTELGSELLSSLIGLLKADFDFRDANPDVDQSSTAWAYSLGAYINPQRQDLEQKCEALFKDISTARNIKRNAMTALKR